MPAGRARGSLPGARAGPGEWYAPLAVRPQDTDEPDETGFDQAYGPEDTSIEELVKACQSRWAVQECLAEAKGEVGLDQYEVRKWDSWHRHITLSLLAHAYLVVTRHKAASERKKALERGARPGHDPTDGARGAPPGARHGRAQRAKAFRFGWSRWRRAHQAVAARCHAARRSKKHAPG